MRDLSNLAGAERVLCDVTRPPNSRRGGLTNVYDRGWLGAGTDHFRADLGSIPSVDI